MLRRRGMARSGSVADLLPVLCVEENHFVLTDGRIGKALACTGLNIQIRSREGADAVASQFAALLNYLPTDLHLQLLVLNAPLQAEEWVPRYLEQFRPPEGLEQYVRLCGDQLACELAGRHIPELRYYAVLTAPGAPAPKGAASRRFGRTRTLGRDRDQHLKAVAELDRAASELVDAFGAMEITARRVGRQEMIDLLWRCANPDWSRDVAVPDPDPSAVDPRSLRDRLTQSRLVRRAEYLRLDWGYERTLSLRALPDQTYPGWLDTLIASGVPFRFALHIDALSKAKERAAIAAGLRRRHAVLSERSRNGDSPDIEQEEAYREAEALLRDMASTDLKTFRMAAFVTVRAASPHDLARSCREVGKALGNAGGTSIDNCQLWQDVAWQATLPLGVNPAGMTYRTVTTNLADSFPFLHHGAGTPTGALIGFSDQGHEVAMLDMHSPLLPNGNLTCLGWSGSGKTMFAQSFALKHVAMGDKVIVLDRSTGHYDDLVSAVPGALSHRITLDSGFRINPWALPRGVSYPDQTKVEYLLDLHTLIAGEPSLAAYERSVLEAGIRAVYRDVPEPREHDLYRWLQRQGRKDLAQRLEPYVGEGTYAGLLDGPTTVGPDAPLEVFNFKGLADRLVPLAMLPLIEYIWAAVRDEPVLMVLDEGWSLLNHAASARFVAEVTRTGRHHGLITLNMSQMASDYDSPLGRAVTANSAVTLLLAQNDAEMPQVRRVFQLTEDEADLVSRLRTVRGLRAGAYLHSRSGAQAGTLGLYVTPEEYWLFTSVPEERELRADLTEQYGGDVWAAVRDLARVPSGSRQVEERHRRRRHLSVVE